MPTNEPSFSKQTFNVAEVLLANSATATQGPSNHPLLDVALADGERPLVVIGLQGFLPCGVDTEGHVLGQEHGGTSIVPFTATAQLFASLVETVDTWSPADRARFYSKVDQYRMGYRLADRRYREGK